MVLLLNKSITSKSIQDLLRIIMHIWDQTCLLVVERSSPCGIYVGPIDKGVNYFVLMLEQLGARPSYSCEGHPNGFYVSFKAATKVAERIANCGYLCVELERNKTWILRTKERHCTTCGFKSNEERVRLLKWAAEAWEKHLGPLILSPQMVKTIRRARRLNNEQYIN